MTTQINRQIAKYRIDDLYAASESRRLARAVRAGRPDRRSLFGLLPRRGHAATAVTAEWWDGTVAAPGRGLPA